MAVTFAPDPVHLKAGAGTAAQQSAEPRLVADTVNGGWDPAPVAATGASAGSPGTFTPAGAVAPANLAAMSGIVAAPTTKWTIGQYVVLGNASEAYWSATAWTVGRAPAVVAAKAGPSASE